MVKSGQLSSERRSFVRVSSSTVKIRGINWAVVPGIALGGNSEMARVFFEAVPNSDWVSQR
eukprot:IDg9227t1